MVVVHSSSCRLVGYTVIWFVCRSTVTIQVGLLLLCYVMLCYVMLCYVMLCYVVNDYLFVSKLAI